MPPQGFDIEIRGGRELAKLGKRLKEAGKGELRRELLKGIRAEAQPLTKKIPAHAADILPEAGGLAERYAGHKVSIRTSLSERSANVRVLSRSRGRLDSVDRGLNRHPVFGNTERWVSQKVRPGWWSEPIATDAPRVRIAVRRVMERVAAKINRSL